MTNTVSKTVSDETLNAIITIESAGRLNQGVDVERARAGAVPQCDVAWRRPQAPAGPARGPQQAAGAGAAHRSAIAVELLARFTEDNQRAVGMNCTGGDLYLAHFLGAGTRAAAVPRRSRHAGHQRSWAPRHQRQQVDHAGQELPGRFAPGRPSACTNPTKAGNRRGVGR
jgi:hypothetical protein